MKKLASILLTLALVMVVGGYAAADNNTNNASIIQTGDDNSADQSQSGLGSDNRARIEQGVCETCGDGGLGVPTYGNTATQTQEGEQATNYAEITQLGADNQANQHQYVGPYGPVVDNTGYVFQYGDYNQASQEQFGGNSTNEAWIRQGSCDWCDGPLYYSSDNIASQRQDGTYSLNYASIIQKGYSNTADQWQGGYYVDNDASIIQIGAGNVANQHQAGEFATNDATILQGRCEGCGPPEEISTGNYAEQNQNATTEGENSMNTALITQLGDDNTAVQNQGGFDNINDATIFQYGYANDALQNQDGQGNLNTALINQGSCDGCAGELTWSEGNSATQNQGGIGNFNNAVITQIGNGNIAMQTQN